MNRLDKNTTIKITYALKEKIDSQKLHKREPNEDVVWRWYHANEKLERLKGNVI